VPALQLGLVLAFLFDVVEVLEEQYPRCLFGIVQLGREAFLVAKFAVDAVEGVCKQGMPFGSLVLVVCVGKRLLDISEHLGPRALEAKDARDCFDQLVPLHHAAFGLDQLGCGDDLRGR
jgi:hypothetical protein